MRFFLVYSLESGDVVGHSVMTNDAVPDIPDGYGVWCAGSIDQWSRAIRISGTDVIQADHLVRLPPGHIQVQRHDIIQAHGHYKANRRGAYDPVPEQLDRITKALAYLEAHGVDIGEAGKVQVARCRAVKEMFPKPVL